jgi:hypothetical protein
MKIMPAATVSHSSRSMVSRGGSTLETWVAWTSKGIYSYLVDPRRLSTEVVMIVMLLMTMTTTMMMMMMIVVVMVMIDDDDDDSCGDGDD